MFSSVNNKKNFERKVCLDLSFEGMKKNEPEKFYKKKS